MDSPVRRRTRLPPELESAAVDQLRADTRERRMAAAQLLARGWALDEEVRLESIPARDRSDGYDEAADPHPHLRVCPTPRND